jgi:hypothetical protein
MSIKFKPTEKFDEVAAKWMKVEAKLSELKVEELKLRNELIAFVFPKGNIPEGTNNVELTEGWVLKVGGKTNVKVDETLIAETMALVKKAVKDGIIPPFDFDEVIKYKPSFGSGAYNNLTGEQQHLVKNCLEMKPGQASVEITKPKRTVK